MASDSPYVPIDFVPRAAEHGPRFFSSRRILVCNLAQPCRLHSETHSRDGCATSIRHGHHVQKSVADPESILVNCGYVVFAATLRDATGRRSPRCRLRWRIHCRREDHGHLLQALVSRSTIAAESIVLCNCRRCFEGRVSAVQTLQAIARWRGRARVDRAHYSIVSRRSQDDVGPTRS